MTDIEKEENKSLIPSRKYEIDLYSDTLIRRGLELAENLSVKVFVQPDQSDRIVSVAFSPDNRFILSGDCHKVKLWDVSSGKLIKTLIRDKYDEDQEPWAGFDRFVCFSTDGQYFLSTGYSAGQWTVKIGKLPSGKIIRSINRGATTASFLPGSPSVLMVTHYNILELWNFKTGISEKFEDSDDRLGLYKLYDDGRRYYKRSTGIFSSMVITTDGQSAVAVVDQNAYTGSTEHELDLEEDIDSFCDSVEWDLDESCYIMLWDINTGHIAKTFDVPNSSYCISADGGCALSWKWDAPEEGDNLFTLWDIQTGHKIKSFGSARSGDCYKAAITPDGKYALSESGSDPNFTMLILWDVETGDEIWSLESTTLQINSITISPNGKCALLVCSDNTLKILSIPDGKEIATMYSFADDEWVTIKPDGYYNCSADGEQYIKVRINNKVQSIKNFKLKYYRPDLVKKALSVVM